MKTILAGMIICFFCMNVSAQSVDTSQLIPKTWRLYKYRSEKGVVYNLDPDLQNSYIIYVPDGTFEDRGIMGSFFKGYWSYDSPTKTIKLKPASADPGVPDMILFKITNITGDELNVSTYTDNGTLTLYLKADKE